MKTFGKRFSRILAKSPKGKVIEWEERQDYVDDLIDTAEHGEMRYVNITLHGRPGKTIIEDNSVITTISHTHKQSPFPKGVPHPPEEATVYTVYIGIRQWNAVIEEIEAYSGDRLIIDGTVFWDADTESNCCVCSTSHHTPTAKESKT